MRTRIVTVITIVTALGLMAVGASVYLVERYRILDQVDVRLEANLDSARYIVADGGAQNSGWSSSTDALTAVVERMSPDDNTGAMGMVDGVITTVPGMMLDLDLRDESAFAEHVNRVSRNGEPTIGTYAEDGVVWRYLAAPIAVAESPAPSRVTFVMVYDLDAELAEFNQAAGMFIVVSAIVLIVVAASGTIVATRLLRPLRQMRETADRVSARSLDERLPIVGNDDVAELAETMNRMLDRLDEALGSQRQLLSDVGHELKTPITVVRGNLEVMDPEDPADTRSTRELAVDELDRMSRLVQDLAASATLHGSRPVQRRSVDAAELMHQIVRKARGITGAEVEEMPAARCVAALDPERITQAMLQLAQNAVTHGGGELAIGSSVDVGASGERDSRVDGPRLRLWVRDYGPGVDDDTKTQIFNRFYQGGGARARGGSGLGLSIVRVIARAHGGDVSVEDAEGGGARFTITVPMGSADPSPADHPHNPATAPSSTVPDATAPDSAAPDSTTPSSAEERTAWHRF